MTNRDTHARGRSLVTLSRGPFGKIYSCPFCPTHVRLTRSEYSLAAFGGAVSKMAAHIEREHAGKLTAPGQ